MFIYACWCGDFFFLLSGESTTANDELEKFKVSSMILAIIVYVAHYIESATACIVNINLIGNKFFKLKS